MLDTTRLFAAAATTMTTTTNDDNMFGVEATLLHRREFRRDLAEIDASLVKGVFVDNEMLYTKRDSSDDLAKLLKDNGGAKVFEGRASDPSSCKNLLVDEDEFIVMGSESGFEKMLVIPKRYIYNGISVNKEDASLLERMRESGREAMKQRLDVSIDDEHIDTTFHIHPTAQVGWLHLHVYTKTWAAQNPQKTNHNTSLDTLLAAIAAE